MGANPIIGFDKFRQNVLSVIAPATISYYTENMKKNETPKCFDNKPKSVRLSVGEYHFCRCGRSVGGVFCDGSHTATSFHPKTMYIDQPTTMYVCMCKNSQSMPYCDGGHRQLRKDERPL